jgi:excisionase family DNA binding protein
MDHDKTLMTTAELAAKLNVSTDTVRRMCNAGKWPHTRIGRLYRFTEEHYQTIIATPAAPEPWSKAQRQRIAQLLSTGGYPDV